MDVREGSSISIPRLAVAATHSGAGKTTVAMGLMAAFIHRGYRVQGFKVGPDYIDAAYHARVTGRPVPNLDSWLVAPATLGRIFTQACQGADLAIVEGVMGLYDGRRGSGAGSTAEVAGILQLPVVLVVDARGMAQSAAALVRGYRDFDPRLNLAGVILNRVGSERHASLLREAIEEATGVPVLGALPRADRVTLGERHLGLQASQEVEAADWERVVQPLAELVEDHIDLQGLHTQAAAASPLRIPATPPAVAAAAAGVPVKVAVARDAAFHFYYPEMGELLEACGAEIAYFSPLEAAHLPEDTQGLIIGGGFPEVFLPRLAANRSLLEEICWLAAAGLPVYAECGGLMYLSRAVDGYPLAGVVPARVEMQASRQGLGYRQARALRDNLLTRAGEEVRGHEFHYSRLIPLESDFPWAWEIEDGTREGFARGNVLASYLHLHWASHPAWAVSFLRRAAAFGQPGNPA